MSVVDAYKLRYYINTTITSIQQFLCTLETLTKIVLLKIIAGDFTKCEVKNVKQSHFWNIFVFSSCIDLFTILSLNKLLQEKSGSSYDF